MPKAERIVPLCQSHSRGVAHQFAMENNLAHHTQAPGSTAVGAPSTSAVRAPHDFGNFHRFIVDHNRELVGGNIVAPPDQKIAEILALVFAAT